MRAFWRRPWDRTWLTATAAESRRGTVPPGQEEQAALRAAETVRASGFKIAVPRVPDRRVVRNPRTCPDGPHVHVSSAEASRRELILIAEHVERQPDNVKITRPRHEEEGTAMRAIPTTEQVRDGFVFLSAGDNPGAQEGATEDFYHWLRSIKAEAWEEGSRTCDRTWIETADLVTPDEDRIDPRNPYRAEGDAS